MNMDNNGDLNIRPLVLKYEKTFICYVRKFGAETVKKVLNNGHCGQLKLTIMKNKKDRAQMIQLLGI